MIFFLLADFKVLNMDMKNDQDNLTEILYLQENYFSYTDMTEKRKMDINHGYVLIILNLVQVKHQDRGNWVKLALNTGQWKRLICADNS